MAADWPVTDLHRALVQERAWLNTARPLEAEDLAGRVILLDFWTFCCSDCMHLFPELLALEQKYHEKLTVIGVHSAKFTHEKDAENVRAAVMRYELPHPVVSDPDFAIWNAFKAGCWPTIILINPEGKVEKHIGTSRDRLVLEQERKNLAEDVAALIAKYPNANTSALPLRLEKDKEPETLLRFPGKLEYVADVDGAPMLFISDSGHHRILGVRMDGTIAHIIGSGENGRADGAFERAQFNKPQGMAYRDGALYIADTDNHLLRRADLATKKVETIAGNGHRGSYAPEGEKPARAAPLSSPWDVAFYPDADTLAIAMAGTHQLWALDIAKNTLRLLAGSGDETLIDGALPGNALSQPSGLFVHGGKLYFVDSETSALRVLEKGDITTLIGKSLFDFGLIDGAKDIARMQHPLGLCVDEAGVTIADAYNHAIRFYNFASGKLSTLWGGSRGKDIAYVGTCCNEPNDIKKIGGTLFIADTNNHRIVKADPASGKLALFEVHYPKTALRRPAEALPMQRPRQERKVAAGTPVTVLFSFAEGWKLNPQAPSWVALFEGEELRAEFTREQFSSGAVRLPALKADAPLRLQGTFYYCAAQEGSACLVESHDIALAAQAGAPASLRVEIGAAAAEMA